MRALELGPCGMSRSLSEQGEENFQRAGTAQPNHVGRKQHSTWGAMISGYSGRLTCLG